MSGRPLSLSGQRPESLPAGDHCSSEGSESLHCWPLRYTADSSPCLPSPLPPSIKLAASSSCCAPAPTPACTAARSTSPTAATARSASRSGCDGGVDFADGLAVLLRWLKCGCCSCPSPHLPACDACTYTLHAALPSPGRFEAAAADPTAAARMPWQRAEPAFFWNRALAAPLLGALSVARYAMVFSLHGGTSLYTEASLTYRQASSLAPTTTGP